MTSLTSASDIARILEETTERQTGAADPKATVWVSANAGTGKTHVLTMRTLRLLLAGTAPERILCLTYTKAAAAEMSSRVYGALAKWVTASGSDLAEALSGLLQRAATAEELERARTLFAFAIETPGGLKVQTIHAFCERMLQRFPLEAGVPPGFSILDDDTVRTLLRESVDQVLRMATREPDGDLGRALITTIAFATDDQFVELLSRAIAERSFLESVVRFGDDAVDGSGRPGDIEDLLRDALHVRRGVNAEQVNTELCAVLSDDEIRRLAEALGTGGKSDVGLGDGLRGIIGEPPGSLKVAGLSAYFLTGTGKARARLMTNSVKKAYPDLDVIADRAQGKFSGLIDERNGLRAVEATLALITLASAVLQAYFDAKARRAGLDYEDLIEKTASLLASSDNADWVLYKLDGGLDHILVDESQDTSPAQWKIIEALAREFFSGAGAREEARTLFAVGDEKQSIYSFQGAAPEQFSSMGHRFEALANDANQSWRRVPLNLSFRSVPPVLQAVDQVFRDRARTPGLGADDNEDALSHVAARFGRGGLVEVWPTRTVGETDAIDTWSLEDSARIRSPAQELADEISETISKWLSSGERLLSEDRPIVESDILILVRKRNPFAAPMVAALKARGIAVAGADRINLIEQIAVQDLVALGDFLVLPEDDLALACVLKSPMFGMDDDDLLRLSVGRRGTLWKALLDARDVSGKFEDSALTLLAWRKRADFMPPFEFFVDLLDAGGMRARFLARLGTEAAEPIDELLDLMISFDEGAPPSMSGFLSWLRAGKREVKRDMDQGTNEVRVMTVHGAKGLEAPIVFLPDTCTTSSGGGNSSGFVSLEATDLPSSMGKLMMWKVKGSGALEAFKSASLLQKNAERDELNRLLYVAMTRARDRLYVCGFENKRGRDAGCWYDVISSGLEPITEVLDDGTGRKVMRLSSPQTHDTPDTPKHAFSQVETLHARPDWAASAAPIEQDLVVPLAPSTLAPFDIDDEGDPVSFDSRDGKGSAQKDDGAVNLDTQDSDRALPMEPPVQPILGALGERRFLRGTLTHALLEHLPQIDREAWEKAASAYVSARGAELAASARTSIVKEVIAILDHPEFGVLFGGSSQAEVAIGAEIPRPDGIGLPLRLSGVIDRLAVVESEVLIVDYKTNRAPPSAVKNVDQAYLYQLAAYHMALKDIYPSKTIRALILWTQTAQLMEIPDPMLTIFGAKLWELSGKAS